MARFEQTQFAFPQDSSAALAPRTARALAAVMPRLSLDPFEATFALEPEEAARRELELRISAHMPRGRLTVRITDNRHTILSVKRSGMNFCLRLHHMFLDADGSIIQAVARYVSANDPVAESAVSDYIDDNQRKIRKPVRRRRTTISLETRGQFHDLSQMYDEINALYFDGAIDARVTWGHRAPPERRARRHNSIKMGSYSVEDRLIRIHPSLDREFVPRMFLESVMFHEMLHQKHEIPTVEGRRLFHTPSFLAEEATFPNYARARRWERENLERILTY